MISLKLFIHTYVLIAVILLSHASLAATKKEPRYQMEIQAHDLQTEYSPGDLNESDPLYKVVLKNFANSTSALIKAKALQKDNLIKQVNVSASKQNDIWVYQILIAEKLSMSQAISICSNIKSRHFNDIAFDYIDFSVPENPSVNQSHNSKALMLESVIDSSVDKNEIIFEDNNPKDSEELMIIDDTSSSSDSSSQMMIIDDASSGIPGVPEMVDFLDEQISDTTFLWSNKINLEQQFAPENKNFSNAQYVYYNSKINWQINNAWNIKVGGRFDGTYPHESESSDASLSETSDVDYTDAHISFRNDTIKLTLGSQLIRWGKMDNMPPTDKLATLDLSRGVLPEWGENYRYSPAIRGEWFIDKSKFDLVYIPKFRAAELDDQNGIWYPINQREGKILGIELDPIVVKSSTVINDFDKHHAMGLRYSSNYNSIDFALTAQRTQHSSPYFIAAIDNASGLLNFHEIHPISNILGFDAAFNIANMTLRMEAAWLSDVPVTTKSLQYQQFPAFEWATGIEFYPGDGDFVGTLQLSGRQINNKQEIIERDNSTYVSGSLAIELFNGKWKLNTRYNIGLEIDDYYISQKVSYQGINNLEIYSILHYLEGEETTIGGFYQNNKLFNIGIKYSF
ncbi:MAG: hypothetical protein HQL46_12435 [Gammaproteobacteria bacterium]|nr:hypothetical protein [Gammaproteobacteria bacterium]